MKSQIIPQTDLENSLVYFHNELKMYVTDSYRIAKKFQTTPRNSNRNIKATIDIYKGLKSHCSMMSSEISNPNLIESLDIEKEIIATPLKTKRGKIVNGFYLTELGYTLALQQFSTPKLEKTRMLLAVAKLEFSQAFFLMRDIIKNQPQPKLKFKKVDIKKFGEVSEANKLHGKTEEVRGYFRSDKGKELSRLYGERNRLQDRLGGLMDTEILKEIDKIDRRIETALKTPIQVELINNKSIIELEDKKGQNNDK